MSSKTFWDIQRLYILFIVCVCAYSPSLVFSGHGGASVDAMWSTYGESWGGTLTPTANSLGLWRPVGWLGVRHSLVHWTLPLHRVLLFSWVFFPLPLFSDNCFGFHQFSFGHDDFPVLTSVNCCDRFLIDWYFQRVVLYSVVIAIVLFCFQRVSHSVYVLSLPNSDLSLFSLYDLNHDL